MQQLVTRVRNEPPQGRLYGLSPHVIAVMCPPRIVGEAAQQGQFGGPAPPGTAGGECQLAVDRPAVAACYLLAARASMPLPVLPGRGAGAGAIPVVVSDGHRFRGGDQQDGPGGGVRCRALLPHGGAV